LERDIILVVALQDFDRDDSPLTTNFSSVTA